MKKFQSLILLSILFLTLSCAKKKEDSNEFPATLLYLLLSSAFTEIAPTSGTITISPRNASSRTFSYSPGCSGNPINRPYKFYLKRGTSRNLVINFMGGGACWDPKNCLGNSTRTYISQADIPFDPALFKFAIGGILDPSATQNPFADWNWIFVPYCTGDLHWGSNVTSYTPPNGGSPVTFSHNGFQNFLAVLDFVQRTDLIRPTTGNQIFVTGQSAGGYGAVFNFPFVKEAFPSLRVNMVGDAANGIVTNGFQQNAIIGRWGAQNTIPWWIPNVNINLLTNGSLGTLYANLANFYSDSRFGQYSTEFDGNQRYFFNVMTQIDANKTYVDNNTMWGSGSGFDTPDSVSCSWRSQSRTKLITEASVASNYKYYIASGDVHTISTSSAFYTESTGGQSLLDWYNQLLSGSNSWTSRDCRSIGNCNPPVTQQSPNRISCP